MRVAKIALMPVILVLYLYFGGWQQVLEYNRLTAQKPAIMAMKKKIMHDPSSVIKTLEQYPNDPKAQVILFKMLVGMHKYQKADVLYRKITRKTEDIDSLYAGVIVKLALSPEEKIKSLRTLKADQRLIQLYTADVLVLAGKKLQAKKTLQKLLTQITESDQAYLIVKDKINNLQNY